MKITKSFEAFKNFALRGNMIDLTIGFTVGAAFTTVVKSLVNDIIMPPLGLLTGNADFGDLFFVLSVPEGVVVPERGLQTLQEAQELGVVTLNYGMFINSCLSLLIVAFAMFALIRLINRLDEELDERLGDPKPADEPKDKKCPHCRTMIPYRATRCPNCTSQLEEAVAASS